MTGKDGMADVMSKILNQEVTRKVRKHFGDI